MIFKGRTIAITGASGKLGRCLVPALVANGADVRLFGRDLRKLNDLFPGSKSFELQSIDEHLDGCSDLIDLAVRNNDAHGSESLFFEDNYVRPKRYAALAQGKGLERMLVINTFHALDPDESSAYASSKRALGEWVREREDSLVRQVIVPKIDVSPRGSVRAAIYSSLRAFKPVTSYQDAQAAIFHALSDEAPREITAGSISERHWLYRVGSFLLDMAFVLAVVIFLGWLLLLVAIAIRLDSKGPAIFAQERVGRDEKTFTLYKFRTMSVGTKQAGTHEVSAVNVTRIGKFVRKAKIDEFPQIINIVRRELSLVGPRPCLPVQRELVDARRALGVTKVRPGVTGLAQVRGIDMSEPHKLAKWDARYLVLRSLTLDLRIVLQTFLGRGGGDRVAG